MEGNWFLFSEDIQSKYESYKTILTNNSSAHENAMTQLQIIVDEERLTGQALNKFRLMLTDYYAVMQLCIEANAQDYTDCDTLIGMADETLDGDYISDMYNEAERKRDEYKEKASIERQKAQAFQTSSMANAVPNPYVSTALQYQQLAQDCQDEMDMWQKKKDKYDDINANSSSLFTSGKELRESVKNLLTAMDSQCISDSYSVSISRDFFDNLPDGLTKDALAVIVETRDYQYLEIAGKYPEYADIIVKQKEIDALQARIDACESETAKTEMLKVLERWKSEQELLINQQVYTYDRFGNITGTKIEQWYNANPPEMDRVEFFVNIYEINHPEAKANMDHLFDSIINDTNGLYTDPHYAQDMINIRFITYTAPEPERSILIEYAGVVKVATFDENNTQHWSNKDQTLHFDLDGYYTQDSNGNTYFRTKGMEDDGGPYRSFFHEMGHAIDDLYVADGDGTTINGKSWLSYQPDANGMSLQDYTRLDVENNLTMSITMACRNTGITGNMDADTTAVLNFVMSSETDPAAAGLSANQIAIYQEMETYYNHRDASGSMVSGTVYNTSAPYRYETYRDVFQGYTNNQFGYGGHTTSNYWYDTNGNETYGQSKEFFAETFSERITYSPNGQYSATSTYFPNGVSRYEDMIQELSE